MRWIPKVVALPSPCGPPRELAASGFYGQAQMCSNARAYCHFIYLFYLCSFCYKLYAIYVLICFDIVLHVCICWCDLQRSGKQMVPKCKMNARKFYVQRFHGEFF